MGHSRCGFPICLRLPKLDPYLIKPIISLGWQFKSVIRWPRYPPACGRSNLEARRRIQANPHGFFEDREMNSINEALLASCRGGALPAITST